MMKILSVYLCLLSVNLISASGMGRLFYAISEGVIEEFSTNLTVEETEAAFYSIKVSASSREVEGCDQVYKGSVIIKEEKIYFDVCVDINEDRSFDVAVSERQADD